MTLPLNHAAELRGIAMGHLAATIAAPRRMGWANAHAIRAQHEAEVLAIISRATPTRCLLRLVKG